MGAVFFLFLMAILFSIAVFFIIVCVILLIIRKVRKRRGKTVKKSWLVIIVFILAFNIIVAMIPVGYIAFLRHANSSNITKIIYAESGKAIYWPMGEYVSTTNWFEMDGIKYVKFREGFSEEPFFINVTDDNQDKPVANIRYNQAATNAVNEVMTFLLAGSTSDKLNVSTIYPLTNENGFEFFEISGTAGNGVFCPELKLDSIKAYYADISNYDTQNLTCEYAVYTDKEGSGVRGDTPYNNIKKNVTVAPKVFNELRQIIDSQQGRMSIKISQKYIELDEAAQPGTPVFGYDERELFAYSKDKMVYRHLNLVLIDGRVYIEGGSGGGNIDGYPLATEMNQYIIDAVFVD